MKRSILKALVTRYVEAFDKADIRIIEEMYAPDGVVEDPVGSEPKVGIEAIKAFYQKAFDSGAKLELEGQPRCAGNCVAFQFQVRLGNMKISPIDVFEVNEEGRISRMRAFWSSENMG